MRVKFPRWQSFLDLFLVPRCPLCERPAVQVWCRDCQRQLQLCQFPHPAQNWQAPLPVLAWGKYDGALKRSLVALKYHNCPQLAQPLGESLAKAWLTAPVIAAPTQRSAIQVVPIPLHASKQQQRGYNQADLLAQRFCQITGLPLQRQGLLRVQATTAQFGLSPQQRQQNLVGAFAVGPRLKQKIKRDRSPQTILLLDDIYTTGATAAAATQALQQAGLSVLGIVTVAQAIKPPRQPTVRVE